jgi:hypothetical protein
MSKFFLLSFTALTAFVMADGDTPNSSTVLSDINLFAGRMDSDCKPKPVECKPKPKPCEPCVRKGIAPNVLTSSRPCDDVGLYLFADALYWHADVTNAEWAFVTSTAVLVEPTSAINQELAFKWNWGFRVGVGYEFDHDQWDSDIYYTWFVNNAASGSTSQTSFKTPVGGAATSLNSGILTTPSLVSSGTATTKLNFQVLDWELGNAFYIRNALSIRPHVGIKGSWIRLTESETFTNATASSTYTISYKTKSWSAGPSAGINSNWYFGCANTMPPNGRGDAKDRPMWSIFGDVSGALMYGHFNNTAIESSTVAGVSIPGTKLANLNRNLMVPVLTGVLGLAWDMCFACDKMHLGIRAGYELQYWFRQNQRLSNLNNGSVGTSVAASRYTRTTGDLALQGLTIDVRFDF